MAKLALLGGKRVTGDDAPPPVRKDYFGTHHALEEAFRKYFKCRYVKCHSWGTGALTAGMVAAGVGPGDEVIVPSSTWPASVSPILHVNAVPIFADIDARTFTIDPEDVKRKITSRTKAIIAVDFYGHPADIPALKRIAKPKGIIVVEDACQATGAEIRGKKVGNIADMTAFSFSGKPITSSSGGLFTTNKFYFYEKALCAGEHTAILSRLSNRELRSRYAPTLGYGWKTRMDPHAGTTALEQLRTLDARNNARIRGCDFLTEALSGIEGLTTPYVRPGFKHVYHQYTVRYDEQVFGVPRDLFLDAVRAEGLGLMVAYVSTANYMYFPGGRKVSAGPIHLRPIFQSKDLYGRGCPFHCPHYGKEPDYSKGSLPVTERIVEQELNIEQQAFPPKYDPRKMQTYLDAITKVIDNIDELRKRPRRKRRTA